MIKYCTVYALKQHVTKDRSVLKIYCSFFLHFQILNRENHKKSLCCVRRYEVSPYVSNVMLGKERLMPIYTKWKCCYLINLINWSGSHNKLLFQVHKTLLVKKASIFNQSVESHSENRPLIFLLPFRSPFVQIA